MRIYLVLPLEGCDGLEEDAFPAFPFYEFDLDTEEVYGGWDEFQVSNHRSDHCFTGIASTG